MAWYFVCCEGWTSLLKCFYILEIESVWTQWVVLAFFVCVGTLQKSVPLSFVCECVYTLFLIFSKSWTSWATPFKSYVRDYTERNKEMVRKMTERGTWPDRECKTGVREEEEEEGWSVEEERKRSNQACVHNEQDEMKGEQREMRGIQKCSRRGKREVCVCVCESKRGGVGGGDGERARDREEGLERAPEAVWERERERETAYSDFTTLYKLPSPSRFTLLSSLQSPQWEPDMHYHCVPTAYPQSHSAPC